MCVFISVFVYFHVPVLLRAECWAAAAVAVDLLHSRADIIVAHVQHVEAGCRWRGHQGRVVQQGQTALGQSRLHTHKHTELYSHFKCSL